MPPVFRFAPSPNGPLHLGHAYAALRCWDICRTAGGRMLVRIENIDPGRSRPEFEAAILEDLAWLGLEWETPERRQSEHMADYRTALEKLEAKGLTYPGFMSRAEIRAATIDENWPRDPDGAPHYPPDDRNLPAGEVQQRLNANAPHTRRLAMDTAMAATKGDLIWRESGSGPDGETGEIGARPERWGDVMLGRRDVPTTYHLAVVVDDATQGVTHVVRGEDLFHATSVHVLLQNLLGLPTPAYHHHRLILDEKGRKLSKRDGAIPLAAMREAGRTPDDIKRLVGL